MSVKYKRFEILTWAYAWKQNMKDNENDHNKRVTAPPVTYTSKWSA